ncbi:MAG: hypothetical protein KF805_03220 [Phycisphaeraceae bacterium]|nr:hypothetical protein [Phycisphaeraceae bacterium]
MKLVIRPIHDQQRELDQNHRLVSAIAEELWRWYGGNERLNWVEIERHLQHIVGEARAQACETDVIFVAPIPTGDAQQMPDERTARSDDDEFEPSRATCRAARPIRGVVCRKDAATSRLIRSTETKHSRVVAAVTS